MCAPWVFFRPESIFWSLQLFPHIMWLWGNPSYSYYFVHPPMNELCFLHVIFQVLIPNGTSDMGRMTFTSFVAYCCCCLVAKSYLCLSSPTLWWPQEPRAHLDLKFGERQTLIPSHCGISGLSLPLSGFRIFIYKKGPKEIGPYQPWYSRIMSLSDLWLCLLL